MAGLLRSELLAQITHDLDAGERLLTLVGPGGIGKTWLARAVMAGRSGGVWVELASETDGSGVLRRVSAALNLPGLAEDAAVIRSVVALLSRLGQWLILDNAEQLGADAVQVVAALRASGAGLLITSRVPLGVPGERVCRVEPLDARQGSEFFVERAQSAVVDADRDAFAIAAIVQLVGGNPLGIELAASHTHFAGAEQIRDTLQSGLDLEDLSGQRPGRHASLGAVVRHTWELLPSRAQRDLQGLCTFAGTFRLQEARALGVRPRGVSDLQRWSVIHTRVEHGVVWLKVFEEARVWVLAERPPDPAILRAHAEWAVGEGAAACAGLRDGSRTTAIVELELLFPDLRLAANRLKRTQPAVAARALVPAAEFLVRRHSQATADFLAQHGDLFGLLAPADLSTLWQYHVRSLRRTGQLDLAMQVVNRAIESLDPAVAGSMYSERSRLKLVGTLDGEGAVADARHAVSLLSEDALPALAAGAWAQLADALRVMERHADGHQALLRAVAAAGPERGHHHLPLFLALIHSRGTTDDEADEWHAQALALAKDIEAVPRTTVVIHSALAQRYLTRALLDRALPPLSECLPTLRDYDVHTWVLLRLQVATLQAFDRPRDEALAGVEAAAALVREHGPGRLLPRALSALGLVAHLDGDLASAMSYYERANELADRRGVAPPSRLLLPIARLQAGLEPGLWCTDWSVFPVAVQVFEGALPEIALTEALAEPRERSIVTAAVRAVLSRRAGVVPTPWTIAHSGQWFLAPGASRVDLGRRRAARRVLADLLRARLESASVSLDVERLVEVGWPGERMHPDSARDRLYGAVRELRRLGLGDLIQTAGGGYRLDPSLPVLRVDEAVELRG